MNLNHILVIDPTFLFTYIEELCRCRWCMMGKYGRVFIVDHVGFAQISDNISVYTLASYTMINLEQKLPPCKSITDRLNLLSYLNIIFVPACRYLRCECFGVFTIDVLNASQSF